MTTIFVPNKHQGCFEDEEGGKGGARLLDGPSLTRNSSLTQQGCKQFCSTKSSKTPLAPYKYFALEAGTDCYCGNVYKHSLVKTKCKTPCSGNKRQRCGDTGSVDVWKNSDYIGGSSSSKLPTQTPASTEAPAATSSGTSYLERPPQWVGDGVDAPYWPADSKYWEGQEENRPAPAGQPKPDSAGHYKPRPSSGGYAAHPKPEPKPAKPSGYGTHLIKRRLSRFNLW